MCLVCVRTVLSDTTSSRAIAGPSRSEASRRSTSSSRSLSGSTRPPSVRGAASPPTRCGQRRRCRRGDARAGRPSRVVRAESSSSAASPDRRRRTPGPSRPARRGSARAPSGQRTSRRRRVRDRLEDQDLDHGADPPAVLGGGEQPVEQPERVLQAPRRSGVGVLGQQHPRQGDVLVLAQVGQVVVGGPGPGRVPRTAPPRRHRAPPAPAPGSRARAARSASSRRRTRARPRRAARRALAESPSASRSRAIATRQR